MPGNIVFALYLPEKKSWQLRGRIRELTKSLSKASFFFTKDKAARNVIFLKEQFNTEVEIEEYELVKKNREFYACDTCKRKEKLVCPFKGHNYDRLLCSDYRRYK